MKRWTCGSKANESKMKKDSRIAPITKKASSSASSSSIDANYQSNKKIKNNKPSQTKTQNSTKFKASVSESKSANDDNTGHGLPTNPYRWAEDDVSEWIRFIGYSQYCDLFSKEHINGEALLVLNKEDFSALGIYALGHTKNILSKIESLKQSAIKYKKVDPYGTENDFKSPYTFNQNDYWGRHPEAYSRDKATDKSTYWHYWSKLVQHRDFMLEQAYRHLMSRSGLAKEDVDIIWKLATAQNHGRCSFDEFTSIMKLIHLAQIRIPLYIINVPKLVFYHPPLASTEFFEFSQTFSELQKHQVLQNMVGFYNLPSQILDSDDRLMELEKKALRPYHPIHFEINAKVLIATFSNAINDSAIVELQQSTMKTLKEQMGFHNIHNFHVQRPRPKELGMTPAGPTSPIANEQPINVNQKMEKQHTYNNGKASNDALEDKLNIQEMQRLYLSDNFWDEFRIRSQMDKILESQDSLIRTKVAMQLISKTRNMPLKSVKFTDDGVKLITNRRQHELKEILEVDSSASKTMKARILGLSERHISMNVASANGNGNHNNNNDLITSTPTPELYRGIIIEGLPELITSDDEYIRKLDSAVLNEFIVSHIEVVDNVLRITFASDVTHQNINSLRKYLKAFLKDDVKLDKNAMKNISIIPHTKDTWKGETTVKSVEQHSMGDYMQMGMESITATSQQPMGHHVYNHHQNNPYNHPAHPPNYYHH